MAASPIAADHTPVTSKSWLLSKSYQKKLRKKFNKRRHHHIRMATVGKPGTKIVDSNKLESAIISYRQEIVYELYKLRKKKIWKEHVDGGLWFFEYTIDLQGEGKVKVNPHLHLVLLCPKMFPVKQINEYVECLSGIGLGRFHISTPRHADGRLKKSSASDAINYCLSYLKKDNQLDGKNRSAFGNMFN